MRNLDYDDDLMEWMQRAFEQNTGPWQPMFGVEPTGWSPATRKRLAQVFGEADSYVQTLNSRFTDPSGHSLPRRVAGGMPGRIKRSSRGRRPTGTADASR